MCRKISLLRYLNRNNSMLSSSFALNSSKMTAPNKNAGVCTGKVNSSGNHYAVNIFLNLITQMSGRIMKSSSGFTFIQKTWPISKILAFVLFIGICLCLGFLLYLFFMSYLKHLCFVFLILSVLALLQSDIAARWKVDLHWVLVVFTLTPSSITSQDISTTGRNKTKLNSTRYHQDDKFIVLVIKFCKLH